MTTPHGWLAGEAPSRDVRGDRDITMLRLVAEHDWAGTSIGPVASWPASLRTIVGVVLRSRFPMLALWGRDLVHVAYNDAGRGLMRDLHPGALGAPARAVWAEIWDVIGPMLDRVVCDGASTWSEDLSLPLTRSGRLEEAYFTFSYSPLVDDAGVVGGVLVTCQETTASVRRERELATLRAIAARTVDVRTEDAACAEAARAIATNPHDVPFAALYVVGKDGIARRAATCGDAPGPGSVDLRDHVDGWPLGRVARTGLAEVVPLGDGAARPPEGGWIEAPREAYVVPLGHAGPVVGFLVAGISAGRALDADYRRFLALLADQVGATLAGARARHEAEAGRQALYQVLAQAPVAIAVWHGPEHVFELANPRYEALFGRKDLVGRRVRDAFPEEELHADGVFDLWDHVYATGEPYFTSAAPATLDRRGDGGREQVWYSFSLSPLRDAGQVIGLVCVAVEVTEMVEARRVLAEKEARLRLATRAGAVGTFVWEVAANRLVGDDQLAAQFGLPADALAAGIPIERLMPAIDAADRDRCQRDLEAAIACGDEYVSEYRVRGADGQARWVVARGRVDRAADGSAVQLAGAVADISERRAASEALAAANRIKDEFLAVLGHELRNPLAPITLALQLLKERVPSARELDVLDRQVAHLTRLVDDLLDISRITRGMIELRKERVFVSDAITKAADAVTALCEQRRHRLEVRVGDPSLAVDADPVRLVQVLVNLLVNAAKYTDVGGRIDVLAERVAGDVEIRVRDTGIGIAADMLPRVFDLFSQERQAIDRAHGGLGLGLAIVRSLVGMHGGAVTARSDGPGRGSEFVVTLPEARLPQTEELPVRRAPPGRARVLVVDDHHDAAELLGEALERMGYDVSVAFDGPSALRVAAAVRPQLALLDLGLPVMDGYELCRRLRAQGGPPIKTVAVTGYGHADARARAKAAGFDVHLVKPIDLDRLANLIEQLVAGC